MKFIATDFKNIYLYCCTQSNYAWLLLDDKSINNLVLRTYVNKIEPSIAVWRDVIEFTPELLCCATCKKQICDVEVMQIGIALFRLGGFLPVYEYFIEQGFEPLGVEP